MSSRILDHYYEFGYQPIDDVERNLGETIVRLLRFVFTKYHEDEQTTNLFERQITQYFRVGHEPTLQYKIVRELHKETVELTMHSTTTKMCDEDYTTLTHLIWRLSNSLQDLAGYCMAEYY